MWRWACAVALLALHAVSHGAPGMDPFNVNVVSQGEFARLPDYCRDTQTYAGHGDPTPRQARWLSLMGDTFWHLHHYCWGMLKAMRAEDPDLDEQRRNSLLSSAIGEFHYVLERAPKDFPLLPEIHYREGLYNDKLGRPVDALTHYDLSRAAKPDYWPPYVGIADVNLRIGRRAGAIEILEKGLQLMPNEPRLLEALERAKAAPDPASRQRKK